MTSDEEVSDDAPTSDPRLAPDLPLLPNASTRAHVVLTTSVPAATDLSPAIERLCERHAFYVGRARDDTGRRRFAKGPSRRPSGSASHTPSSREGSRRRRASDRHRGDQHSPHQRLCERHAFYVGRSRRHRRRHRRRPSRVARPSNVQRAHACTHHERLAGTNPSPPCADPSAAPRHRLASPPLPVGIATSRLHSIGRTPRLPPPQRPETSPCQRGR